MLGILRKHKNSPVVTVVLGLVALLMVGFGVSIQGSGGGTHAAKVNGEEISDLDYSARYAIAFRNRQAQDRAYDRAKAERDNLRQQVMNSMVLTKVLAQTAQKQGLAVDDDVLRREILDNPEFQENGAFDRGRYERVLRFSQMSERRFEAAERDRILASLILAAADGLGASEAEIRETYEAEERKVNVAFIQVPKREFEGQVGSVTPADAEAWAKTPDAEEKIKKFYARHKGTRYDVPKRVCAQHILVKNDKSLPPNLQQEARAKIEAAREALKGGMEFAAAALKYSDDNNKEKGGDLGCFGAGQMVPQIEEAAFGLEPGKVSGIVETGFGWHLVKVTEHKDPVMRKLDDVRDEIALELAKTDKAAQLAKARAEQLLRMGKDLPSLEAVAEAANKAGGTPVIKAEETGPFTQGRDFLPRLGMAKEVATLAWTLTEEQPLPAAPVETDNAWVVLKLKERTEPKEEEFAQMRTSITYGLTARKRTSVAEAWSKWLREKNDVKIDPVAVSYDDAARAARRPR